MLKFIKAALILVAALIVLAAAAFLIIGPERLWAKFGPSDLGNVDFDLDRLAVEGFIKADFKVIA